MVLWLLMIMLCGAVAVTISLPLARRLDEEKSGETPAAAIYRDQLSEIDRDLQSGAINAGEAQSAKMEVERRLHSATKNQMEARPVSSAGRHFALAATAGAVIIGSATLYNILGSPDLPSVTPGSTIDASDASATSAPDQVEALVEKLKARMKTNPDDAEGWRLLGWTQFNLQHYTQAIDAYAKALALDPSNAQYKSAYAEAITQGSQGIVTPKALALFAEVLAKDPKDARARFYDALSHEQAGDQKVALTKWLALYADAPSDAGWREDVKQRIAKLARATNDQQEMIKGMVEGLAVKMAANPHDLDGWMRLMRAYKVLNEPAKAKGALARALAEFSADQSGTDKLKDAATELGIN
jgi:cytochrome c-type biogenesis protein CcmH